MQITIYSGFKKRPNSTKQPTSGTVVTVTLKEATSIENPTFILAGALSSYENITAVKWGSRYYFVTDVTSQHNGITELSCSIDRLATFKTDIGNADVFIERCSNAYDETLIDPYTSSQDTTYTKGVASAAIFPSAPNEGVLAVQVASTAITPLTGGGVGVLFVEPGVFTGNSNPTIEDVLAKLWDENVSTNLKKTLADAWSAIIRAVYIPCFTVDDLAAKPSFSFSNMYLGKQVFTDVKPLQYLHSQHPIAYSTEYEFDPESMAEYSTFKWRNLPPFCDWFMYLPFYGPVDVAADLFLNHAAGIHPYLVVKATVDYCTGELTYTLNYRVYTGLTPHDAMIAKYQTRMGVDVPLSNIRQGNALETMGHVMSAVGGAVAMDPFHAISEGVAGVISSMQTQVSTVGGLGVGVGMALAEFGTDDPKIRLYCNGHRFGEEPNAHKDSVGCMLMRQATVAGRGGYVKCNNASVDIAGTQADKDAVNSMLNSGIFYE